MGFTVIMQGESGELEVHDNPGADRPEIDSWDAAIRAAWVRLGRTGSGWTEATILGPSDRMVHLYAGDKEARAAIRLQRSREEEAAYRAELAADPSRLTDSSGLQPVEATRLQPWWRKRFLRLQSIPRNTVDICPPL